MADSIFVSYIKCGLSVDDMHNVYGGQQILLPRRIAGLYLGKSFGNDDLFRKLFHVCLRKMLEIVGISQPLLLIICHATHHSLGCHIKCCVGPCYTLH